MRCASFGTGPAATRWTVVALHGQMPNPLDHRQLYPPLCTVRFALRDVSGRPSRDFVTADLHEDWLEPATEGS